MLSLTFELFEAICEALRGDGASIITESILSPELMEDLRDELEASSNQVAFAKAVKALKSHFSSKGSQLPFSFDLRTGSCQAREPSFIDFISKARSIRGSGQPAAKQFEIDTCKWLSRRLTGWLHRVGWPRGAKKSRRDFVAHLRHLGFDANVLEPHDNDGGFDLLWLPPLGAVPIRPIVSVQCKNSGFDREEAYRSVGQASRSLTRHSHMRGQNTFMCCVLFNDYIDASFKRKARGWPFVPLGLTDLAVLRELTETTYL